MFAFLLAITEVNVNKSTSLVDFRRYFAEELINNPCINDAKGTEVAARKRPRSDILLERQLLILPAGKNFPNLNWRMHAVNIHNTNAPFARTEFDPIANAHSASTYAKTALESI